MSNFKEGDIVWALVEKNNFRETILDCIIKCIYKEEKFPGHHSVQLTFENGKRGMTFGVNENILFKSLDDLKLYYKNESIKSIKEMKSVIKQMLYERKQVEELIDRDESLKKLLDE